MGSVNNPFEGNSLGRVASKSITYVAGTTGAIATVAIFTVTGTVAVRIFGVCTTALTSGGVATIEVGVTGSTAILIALSTATDIIANEIWVDATPTLLVDAVPAAVVIGGGLDINQKITDATITGGVMVYYCLWEPLSAGATVVAA